MNIHIDKAQENKNQAVANGLPKQQSNSESTFQFMDDRPEAIAQRELQEAVSNSPRVKQLKTNQEVANNSPQVKQLRVYQAMANNYSSSQPYSLPNQQGPTKSIVVQRNQDVTQYAPSGAKSMSGIFIDQHAPDDYTVENAIEIHSIRGAIPASTIIAITGEEMANEIHQYLLGLSDDMSQRLENEEWNQITFETADSYPSIETTLNEDNYPVFSVAEITRIQVRMQFIDGYYQVYHFSRKVE